MTGSGSRAFCRWRRLVQARGVFSGGEGRSYARGIGDGGMDADLAALWSAAATTLVTLMTTDSWERVKAGFAGLWRHARPEQAGAVGADLEAAREAAVAARQDGDDDAVAELTVEWRSRLRRLAGSDAGLEAEVRRLVEEFRPLLPGGSPAVPVVMIARASGGSRVNQAGRDQTVTGR